VQPEAEPGSVLVFRWRGATIAKHAAILATPTTMIHAIEGSPVSEVSLSPWWRRRLAGAFAFPGDPLPLQGGGRNATDLDGRLQQQPHTSSAG